MSPIQVQRKDTVQNVDKVKEMILLFSELSEGDEFFGATKLNKLLFFSDFLAYLMHGKSISGSKYAARPEGPMLENFYRVRDEMKADEVLAVRTNDFWGKTQHRTIALRKPNTGQFTREEMEIVFRVVNEFRGMSASQISALSHEFLGWQAVKFGDEIPYETALVSTRDLTQEEYDFPAKNRVQFEAIAA